MFICVAPTLVTYGQVAGKEGLNIGKSVPVPKSPLEFRQYPSVPTPLSPVDHRTETPIMPSYPTRSDAKGNRGRAANRTLANSLHMRVKYEVVK